MRGLERVRHPIDGESLGDRRQIDVQAPRLAQRRRRLAQLQAPPAGARQGRRDVGVRGCLQSLLRLDQPHDRRPLVERRHAKEAGIVGEPPHAIDDAAERQVFGDFDTVQRRGPVPNGVAGVSDGTRPYSWGSEQVFKCGMTRLPKCRASSICG